VQPDQRHRVPHERGSHQRARRVTGSGSSCRDVREEEVRSDAGKRRDRRHHEHEMAHAGE